MTKLLSISNDPKTVKGEAVGYLTAVMYLAPSDFSGYNVCPMAKEAGCRDVCLNTAGRGQMHSIQEARIRRTKYLFEDRDGFFRQLNEEIDAHTKRAAKKSMIPTVRLNGLSDIRWEIYPVVKNDVEYNNIFDAWPDLQFYDYTKLANRKGYSANYHLTWSFSMREEYLKRGLPEDYNWSVVFNCPLPEMFLGRPVLNGDANDLRFTDPHQVVVGLKAKGKSRHDDTFVVNNVDEAEAFVERIVE